MATTRLRLTLWIMRSRNRVWPTRYSAGPPRITASSDARRRRAGMGDHELVADGDDDDARDDRQVQVGVGVAREPAAVVGR